MRGLLWGRKLPVSLLVNGISGDVYEGAVPLAWAQREVGEGDSITISVLSPGESDPPLESDRDDPDGATRGPVSPVSWLADCFSRWHVTDTWHPPLEGTRKPRSCARFQVEFNGRRLCIAGLPCPGVLAISTLWFSDAPLDGGERASLRVQGAKGRLFRNVEPLSWCEQELKPGDEVSIKLLPRGKCDLPQMAGPARGCYVELGDEVDVAGS